jgi:hypothetical protein
MNASASNEQQARKPWPFRIVGLLLVAAVPVLGLFVLGPNILPTVNASGTVSSSSSADVSLSPLTFDAPTATVASHRTPAEKPRGSSQTQSGQPKEAPTTLGDWDYTHWHFHRHSGGGGGGGGGNNNSSITNALLLLLVQQQQLEIAILNQILLVLTQILQRLSSTPFI